MATKCDINFFNVFPLMAGNSWTKFRYRSIFLASSSMAAACIKSDLSFSVKMGASKVLKNLLRAFATSCSLNESRVKCTDQTLPLNSSRSLLIFVLTPETRDCKLSMEKSVLCIVYIGGHKKSISRVIKLLLHKIHFSEIG